MRTISFRLPETLVERLQDEAKSRSITRSSLIRERLATSIAAAGGASCYDLASDLAGSLKGAPRDLALGSGKLLGFGA